MTKATGPVSAGCWRSMPTAQQIRVSDWTRRDHRQAVRYHQSRCVGIPTQAEATPGGRVPVVHAGEGMSS